MRRKLLFIILAVALCVGGVGCGNISIDKSVENDSSAIEVVMSSEEEATTSETKEEAIETSAVASTVEIEESTESSAEDSSAETTVEVSTVEESSEAPSETPAPTEESKSAPAPEATPTPEPTPAPSVEPTPEPSSEAPAPTPEPQPEIDYDAPENWILVKESVTCNADTHSYELWYQNKYTCEIRKEFPSGAHEWITGPILPRKAPDGTITYAANYICSVCEYDSARVVPETVSDTAP